MKTSPYLLNAAIRQQVLLERIKAGKVRDVTAAILQVEKDLVAIIKDTESQLVREMGVKPFEDMLKELKRVEYEAMGQVEEQLFTDFKDLSAVEAQLEAKSIGRVLRNTLSVPDASKLYRAARKTPISATGELLEGFVQNISASQLKKTEGLMRKAYDQGWTVQQAVQGLRGTKANRFGDGITKLKTRQAEAVVRTSLQHVSSTARFTTWAENSDIIDGYEWVSTLDGSTSPQCRSLDGEKFELGKGPKPPIHVNCRSTTVPTFDDGLDFLDTDATRSSMNGPIAADTSYYEWLKTQDRAFVTSTLGRERAALFLDQGLSAEQFRALSIGKTFEPLTVAEMRTELGKALPPPVAIKTPVAPTTAPTAKAPKGTTYAAPLSTGEAKKRIGTLPFVDDDPDLGGSCRDSPIYTGDTLPAEVDRTYRNIDRSKTTNVVVKLSGIKTDQGIVYDDRLEAALTSAFDPATGRPLGVRYQGSVYLADGNHRVLAEALKGGKQIEVEIFDIPDKAKAAKILPDPLEKMIQKRVNHKALSTKEFELFRSLSPAQKEEFQRQVANAWKSL